MQYDYIVGIDPGTNTGLAVYSCLSESLISVETTYIHLALQSVINLSKSATIFVRFEDATTWRNFGRSRRQTDAQKLGAGSIRRDSKIWRDFLKDSLINHEPVTLGAVKTKMSVTDFRKLTGYKGNVDDHGRDAALLCWKYKPKRK